MQTWTNFVIALTNANPAVLVTIISIVALLVVGACVKHLANAIARRGK